MITSLPTSPARFGAIAAMLLLAGAAQALTFISPMGEPFRSKPGETKPEEAWFAQADANHDGKITLAEFTADAGRFFKTLDTNKDARIEAEEIQHYEDFIAPETISGGDFGAEAAGGGHQGGARHGRSRRRDGVSRDTQTAADEDNVTNTYLTPPNDYDEGNMGAARFSYFDMPEPLSAADANFDRTITPREYVDAARQRFIALDANHDGLLTRDELPKLGGGGGWNKGHREHTSPPPFSGGMGAPGTPPGG